MSPKQSTWDKALETARVELSSKTLLQIQVETTRTWAARACVAYESAVYAGSGDFSGQDRATWLHFAEEAAHEAVEHAGLAELLGATGAMGEVLEKLTYARATSA